MTMKKIILIALSAAMIGMPYTAHAGVEKEFRPGSPLATTPWYSPFDEQARQADLNFIAGMRPHHAGALTMSEDYLSDAGASNVTLQRLARGIIRNQEFEIGVLDNLETLMQDVSGGTTKWRHTANMGQAQKQRFFRTPMPVFWSAGRVDPTVSHRDVQFAKAMIVHHQGALDMANDYLRDPRARNGYLKLFCLDILLDQAQEIALMESIIAAYPGNPDDVKITPDMIHGMDGMLHGGGHHHHHHH